MLFIALVFALGVAAMAQDAARTQLVQKRVLLLYAERSELPANRAIDTGLREALAARGSVEVFAEYLDFARFPADRHTGAMIDFLRSRYDVRKLDLVITTGFEALQFALAKCHELFAGHLLQNRAAPNGRQKLPSDVTGVPLYYDFCGSISARLRPRTARGGAQPGL